jgi:hypothetical protein
MSRPERRDDASGHGAAEAERVTDREHPVADPRLAVGQLGEREVGAAGHLISATSVRGSVPITFAV